MGPLQDVATSLSTTTASCHADIHVTARHINTIQPACEKRRPTPNEGFLQTRKTNSKQAIIVLVFLGQAGEAKPRQSLDRHYISHV